MRLGQLAACDEHPEPHALVRPQHREGEELLGRGHREEPAVVVEADLRRPEAQRSPRPSSSASPITRSSVGRIDVVEAVDPVAVEVERADEPAEVARALVERTRGRRPGQAGVRRSVRGCRRRRQQPETPSRAERLLRSDGFLSADRISRNRAGERACASRRGSSGGRASCSRPTRRVQSSSTGTSSIVAPSDASLREQLSLAGEAGLADQAVAVVGVCVAQRRGPVDAEERRDGLRLRGRARDARRTRRRRSAAAAERSRSPSPGRPARRPRPLRPGRSSPASASRSLVVSASSVTTSASSWAALERGEEARAKRRSGALVLLELDELDRQRAVVGLDDARPCVLRSRRRR